MPAPAVCAKRLARTRQVLVVLLVSAALAFTAGCGRRGHAAPEGGATVPPSRARLKRNVELIPVRQEKMTSFVETVGYLDAECQTDIAAGVAGVVEEVNFREGDWVVKDSTVLVRIEPRKYEALLAQADANLKKAEANVERITAMTRKTEAGIRDAEQTLDLRRTIYDNIRRVGRSAKIEERQEAQAMVEVTAARLDVARAEKAVSAADLEAARKEVDAARAMRDLAQHNLERSRVRAPYTGQINQRKVTRGSYLEDKSTIATMADLSRLRLVGYIPERATPIVREMLQAEKPTRAAFLAGGILAGPLTALAAVVTDVEGATPPCLEFRLRSYPHRRFYGRIFYLSTVANPDTHLFEAKAEVPLHGLGGELRPGYTAKIRCPLPGRPSTLIVPEEAVRASEHGFVAFRPRAETNQKGDVEYFAERVEVELGQREGGVVEVLSGLRAGDWIVHRGAEALEAGTPLALPKEQMAILIGKATSGR